MTVRSTQLSMGYVSHTDSQDNCGACASSYLTEAPHPPGRKCSTGSFFVLAQATCRRFRKEAAAVAKVQIGPTDI